VQAIQMFLFDDQRFGLPEFGQSNLPQGAVLDHPGVYENAKYAYLHEALIGRRGIPAVLAILLEEVCQQLLLQGAIDFAVRIECSRMDRSWHPLPPSEMLAAVVSNSLQQETCETACYEMLTPREMLIGCESY
jgi:hypothetical protein